MWIEGAAVLHIIDKGTRYWVAKFLQNDTSEHVWKVLQKFWFIVFTGYPYIIAQDQGLQFTSEYLQVSCS